jgi:UDP-N-acetylglucosamine:LPS N-acetylglucosamine transferase
MVSPDEAPMAGRASPQAGRPRILILTASVGEGHDLPARMLAAQLRSEYPGSEIVIEDGLAPMGRLVTAISADSGRIVFFHLQWLWDVGFWFFAGTRLTRAFTQMALTRIGGKGLARLLDRVDADVIVSTYPNTMEVLRRLRRSGRVRVPVCSAITDLSALHYWAGAGIDVHLIAYPQSIYEVKEIAGESARVVTVHGLTAPDYLVPCPESTARREVGVPTDGPLVLVSGGGWGVGDIIGAVEVSRASAQVAHIVCLCGRNEALRRRLTERFGQDPRVRVEGFTDRMAVWMAAANVLIHSTGGLTVLEAMMRGLPTISYGWGRGHIRLNNAAFRRFGLAEVVAERSELAPAIARALARGRTPTDLFEGLPSAASVVVDSAGWTKRRDSGES